MASAIVAEILKKTSPGRLSQLTSLFAAPSKKKVVGLGLISLSMLSVIAALVVNKLVYFDYLSQEQPDPADPRRIAIMVFDIVSLLIAVITLVRTISGVGAGRNPGLEVMISMLAIASDSIRLSYVSDPELQGDDARRIYSVVVSVANFAIQGLLLLLMVGAVVGVAVVPADKLFR